MSRQGSLSIKRMCDLVQVSRAGFYWSLQEDQPIEEEMVVRTTIQGIRRRTPPSVWLPTHHGGTASARDAGQPQTGGAAHARRQLARRAAAGLRGHDRFRSCVRGGTQPGQPPNPLRKTILAVRASNRAGLAPSDLPSQELWGREEWGITNCHE